MKKILLFLMVTGLLAGCYEDYRVDFEHSTVAFSAADGGSNRVGVLYRSVVKDEGLKLDIGIYLAGILENTKERWADFVIDPTLLDGTAYQMMPDSYYSLSNTSRFIIPPGELIGRVTLTLDSASFVNDTAAVIPYYAVPFRLTATSEDSILSTQSTKIVVIKYINHYEGFYDHTGTFTSRDAGGTVTNSGEIDNVLSATTVMLDTIRTNGMMNLIDNDFMMDLLINSDHSVFMEYFAYTDFPIEHYNVNQEISDIDASYNSTEFNLEAINDGYEPVDSADTGPGAYNWPNDETWDWVEYEFSSPYMISSSGVYWWGNGDTITIPYASNIKYLPLDAETDTSYIAVPNPVGTGIEPNQYAMISFDTIITTKIRVNFIGTQSQGILEWKVWGVPYIEDAVERVTPNGENSFDPSANTFTLNYRVDYLYNNNTTDVSATMTWRNRIRDGVNEWRR